MSEEIKNEKDLELVEEMNNEEYAVNREQDIAYTAEEEARMLLLSTDEIELLTEEGLVEYVQKTEYIIDRMELEGVDDDTYQLYLDMKAQEKLLYKKIKVLNKEIKEKGFFDYVKPWMFIYAIVVVLLGIFPVNPFLPLLLMVELSKKGLEINDTIQNLLYAAYIAILLLPGYISCLLHKRNTRDEKLNQKALMIILIAVTLLTSIGVVVFCMWA